MTNVTSNPAFLSRREKSMQAQNTVLGQISRQKKRLEMTVNKEGSQIVTRHLCRTVASNFRDMNVAVQVVIQSRGVGRFGVQNFSFALPDCGKYVREVKSQR